MKRKNNTENSELKELLLIFYCFECMPAGQFIRALARAFDRQDGIYGD